MLDLLAALSTIGVLAVAVLLPGALALLLVAGCSGPLLRWLAEFARRVAPRRPQRPAPPLAEAENKRTDAPHERRLSLLSLRELNAEFEPLNLRRLKPGERQPRG